MNNKNISAAEIGRLGGLARKANLDGKELRKIALKGVNARKPDWIKRMLATRARNKAALGK